MSKKEFNSYGIILLLTGFTMRFLTVGIFRCFGMILRELNDLHDLGQGELNWIPSVNTGCMFLLGPIAGILQHRVGCRLTIILGSVLSSVGLVGCMFVPNLYLLYLTYGIITGTGFCLVSLSANIPINTYFHEKRIMAHSLAGLGAGIGISSMPFLMTVLLETYGWRGTFAILSGLFLQCAVCGMLIKPEQRKRNKKELIEKHETDVKDKKSTLNETKTILKDKHFIAYSFSAFIVQHVFHVPHLIIPTIMSSYGLSPTMQATVFTASGVCSILQRVVMGSFLDKLKAHLLVVMGLSVAVVGGGTVALAFVRDYALFVAYGALFGIFAGTASPERYARRNRTASPFGHIIITLSTPVLSLLIIAKVMLEPTTLLDIVGKPRYGLGLGYFRFLVGLGVSTGPPIAGWLIDTRGKYDWVFYYAGVFNIFGGIILILTYYLKRRELKLDHKQDSEKKENELMIQTENVKETKSL